MIIPILKDLMVKWLIHYHRCSVLERVGTAHLCPKPYTVNTNKDSSLAQVACAFRAGFLNSMPPVTLKALSNCGMQHRNHCEATDLQKSYSHRFVVIPLSFSPLVAECCFSFGVAGSLTIRG